MGIKTVYKHDTKQIWHRRIGLVISCESFNKFYIIQIVTKSLDQIYVNHLGFSVCMITDSKSKTETRVNLD